MEIKAQQYHFETIEYDIVNIFMRLRLSANGIKKLIQEEIYDKGIYDPERCILPKGDNKEFESFQEILRNLNNIVYLNSLLLGAYSILEISFVRICEFIEEHSCPKIEFLRPSREILKECRKYINETGIIDLNEKKYDSIYTRILKVSKLRNLIAHDNGNLKKEKDERIELQKDYKYYAAQKQLTIMNSGQVYINDIEYINTFIKESEKFILLLYKQLEKRNN